ncbi:MAG: ABC transporter ATP-binding protein [Bacillaceae bacterium]|nr:ABC transporter ATP-binding protein [Bacillaceae bacterium]
MKNSQVLLSVQHLSKTYQGGEHEVHALNDVSFDLHQGELLAVMGTSGSGKSTLLNIIGALDKPDAGIIKLKGKTPENMFTEPNATQYRRDHIGFIFQQFHLLKDLSVEENVALPLILKGEDLDEMEEKVTEMLEFVGLTPWKTHRPVQLSGGQQQRVAIARALISSPPIILADELTGNLDFNTSTDILHLLMDMKAKLHQSIIMVTHDPYVATFADRVLFFHDGRIVDEYFCTRDETDMDVILNKFQGMLETSS